MLWEDLKISMLALKSKILKSPNKEVYLNDIKEAIVRATIDEVEKTRGTDFKTYFLSKKPAWYPVNLVNKIKQYITYDERFIWACLNILADQGYLEVVFDERGFIIILSDKLFEEYKELWE